jgi:hypothetical protein
LLQDYFDEEMSDAIEAGDDETDEMLEKNAEKVEEEIDDKEMTPEEEEKKVVTHEEEIISEEENEEERDKENEEEEEAMAEDQRLDQKEEDSEMIDKDVPAAPRYDPAMIAETERSDNSYLAMRSDSLQGVDSSVISVPARQKLSGGVEEGDAVADEHSLSADRRAKSGGQPTEQKSAHRESLKGGEEGAGGGKKEAMDRYFLRNRGISVRWLMGGPILLSLALNSLYCKLTT